MKGPFALVLAGAAVILSVAILFSLAPTIGGSIDTSDPNQDYRMSMTLNNNTNATTGHRNIGDVKVSNTSGYTTYLASDEFSSDSDVGTITLLPEYAAHNNVNGTYYVQFDISQWQESVNTDITPGGDWFSDNVTWVTLLFLGIVASIVIGFFVRW